MKPEEREEKPIILKHGMFAEAATFCKINKKRDPYDNGDNNNQDSDSIPRTEVASIKGSSRENPQSNSL